MYPGNSPSYRKSTPGFWTPGVIAIAMVIAIAAFYLLREHWTHVAGLWPYLLLLLCPLLHLFGHRQHGHNHGEQ